jgi:hypothetical protein
MIRPKIKLSTDFSRKVRIEALELGITLEQNWARLLLIGYQLDNGVEYPVKSHH